MEFVQHFALEADGTSRVDILAQSPTGEGCAVPFSELRFAVERLADTRSGL